MVAPGLPDNLPVLGDVVVGYAVDRFTVPDASKVIGVADIVAAFVCLRQLPPVRPTQIPVAGTVVPDVGVANGIIGDCFAVVSREQVQPFAVAVGVGIRAEKKFRLIRSRRDCSEFRKFEFLLLLQRLVCIHKRFDKYPARQIILFENAIRARGN